MRVVIVDDDSLVVASLATILAADGEIEVAGTGNSCPEAVDIVLTLMYCCWISEWTACGH